MSGEELAHGEGAHALVAEDLGHLLVGGEELLVLGILKNKTKKKELVSTSWKSVKKAIKER